MHSRFRAIATLMAVLLIPALQAATANAEDNRKLIRKSMSTGLTKMFKDLIAANKVTMSDEDIRSNVNSVVEASIASLTDESIAEFTPDGITQATSEWLAGIRPKIEHYVKRLAVAEQKEKDEVEKKEREKVRSVNRRRWVWKPKEWKKILKLEKKIEKLQGYKHAVVENDEVRERVEFPSQTFYRYGTVDFIVWSNINPTFTAELAIYVSNFVKVFPKIFPVKPKGHVNSKLVVVVFSERSEYKEIVGGTIAEWSRGVFTPVMYAKGWPQFTVYSYFYDGGTTGYDDEAYTYDKDWNIIPKKKQKDRKGADKSVTPPNFTNFPYAVIQHEATHAMLRKYIGPSGYVYRNGEWIDLFPIFINEGCATFFQNFDLRNSRSWNLKQVARICSDRWLIAKYLKKNPGHTFNLKKAIAMVNGGGREGTWAPDDGGPQTSMNYATAQSFAHYLLTRKKGRSVFRSIMDKVYHGRPVLDERQTRKLQKGWNKHIREVILTAKGTEGESVSVHELKSE